MTWHSKAIDQTFAALNARVEGLSQAEANKRLETHGPNQLPEAGRPSPFVIIARQLGNPFTFILFFAAIVSFSLARWTDGAFIYAVVLINITIGAIQEWRAETNAASLKKTLRVFPTVIRGGVRRSVDISELVPGDIVHLESGGVVPADMRLVSSNDLKADESLLTGESVPVRKDSKPLFEADTPLGDRRNMAYAGTMIVSGRGAGVVCATGAHTQIGAIAKALTGRGGKPPLLIRMETFSNRIAVVTVALVAALGAGQYLRGDSFTDVFLLVTALVVSAIPEGLPVAITVALSVASSRMGKRNVIVRRLPAVEALGSCTLIATDKTGTLTANRLTVKKITLASGDALEVEGEGLELEGAIKTQSGEEMTPPSRIMLESLVRASALSNEANVSKRDGVVEASGDAVDIAFLVLAEKLGLQKHTLDSRFINHGSLPYEPSKGYSASLDAGPDGIFISVKGAPETVLPMCKAPAMERASHSLHQLAAGGYRVIAVAQRQISACPEHLSSAGLSDLDFLGLVALIDPLRSEAPQAVALAQAAGVDVRMITGDHPDTALAIARQLNPSRPPDRALTGAELARLEGEDRRQAIGSASIFARVEPTQKNLIISELQKQGHFVAVTGDGVNDAPALKAAHVGVAMGAGGTDVARAASDLIITDDNFASLVAGIEEGRAAYDNIRKIIWLLISTAITEVLLFALSLMAGLPMPLTAVQILWLNLVTEGIQDVALAFEAKEPDVMQRPPRSPQEPIFNRQMIEQCLLVGFYIAVTAFALFSWLYTELGYSEGAARNLILLFLVSFNNFHTLNCRSETRSVFAVPVRTNMLLIFSVISAQFLHIGAMHLPLSQYVLDLAPVTISEWAGVIALAATILILGEAYKAVVSRPRARRAAVGLADRFERRQCTRKG